MIDLGIVKPGKTLRIPFSSFDKDDGSSITMTNYAVADILIYKDGNTTERASTAGFTATTDFDGKTGKHLLIIDLADNTTTDFFQAGSEYLVAIDAVTVDTVVTGGWVARFEIGYRGAVLDTFIATLTSQTSFTLNVGPAEDDALNGMWAIIHDAASAVQWSWVYISDYVGSTKTVTLEAGATFTVAAKDNISIMPPMGPPRILRSIDGIVKGTVGSSASTTSIPTSSLDPAAAVTDQFAGRVLVFAWNTATANLRGQMTTITASTAGGTLTVTALTTAPASGDIFAIL